MGVLGIIVTVIIIVLIIMFIYYVFRDPYTLQNLQNGQNMSTVNASSLATNGSNIPSSNFAYSIWFYVNDFNYRYGSPKVIFGRMGSPSSATSAGVSGSSGSSGSIDDINGMDPCPAVVLGAVENNLNVYLGCFPGVNQTPTNGGNTIVHKCSVANVPIQKWVNLVVSVYGRSMDLYIDGKLVRTCLLPGVANVNNNANVYVTPSGGFNGWTSKFQYYPTSLNPQEVYNIYVRGYGGNMFTNFLNAYQLQISLIENGTTQSSVTI
jgi:hypothetical protein